jgi:hypothetical protein
LWELVATSAKPKTANIFFEILDFLKFVPERQFAARLKATLDTFQGGFFCHSWSSM